jgi:hypothetical protein
MKNTFNMNDEATVILTKKGKEILIKHYSQFPKEIRPKYKKIFKAELWLIMKIFGKDLYNGGDIPFENNKIQIERRL